MDEGPGVSQPAGRLRLTATGLRFLPDNGRALAEALARFGGMRRVRVNTVVESVLLEYDPERLDAQAAQEHAEMALARFAMDAMRARHGASTSEDAEAGMSTRQLARRLAVNAGALLWAIRRCAARRGRGGLASSPACRR